MGLDDDLFSQAVDVVATIDFTKARTSDLASVFESTIRHVGGMLSAYELSNRKYPVLVEKASQLADQLAFAWVGVSICQKDSLVLLLSWPSQRKTSYLMDTLTSTQVRQTLRLLVTVFPPQNLIYLNLPNLLCLQTNIAEAGTVSCAPV